MRLAFAGVGHPHAPAWVAAIRGLAGLRLAGAWDPDPARLESFSAAHAVDAWPRERLLSGEAGAILVAGRNPELRPLAGAVLEAGLPALVEKPGGMTSAELAGLARLGAPARVAYFLRHADAVRDVGVLLREGRLGRVSLARLHAGMPASAWQEDRGWFADPANVRGMFLEDGCHVLDIALSLFGPPHAVVACAVAGSFPGGLGEDAMVAVLDYGERLVTIDFSAWEANPWVESWTLELIGTEGSVRAGLLPSWVEHFAGGAWERRGTPVYRAAAALERERVGTQRACYARALEEFCAAVRGEEDAAATLAHALAVIRVAEAAYESAERGVPVHLEEVPAP
jgi:predicted dehydrogenase